MSVTDAIRQAIAEIETQNVRSTANIETSTLNSLLKRAFDAD